MHKYQEENTIDQQKGHESQENTLNQQKENRLQEQTREQPKTKQKPEPVKDERRATAEFMRGFEEMKYASLNEREAGWSGMTRNTATQYAQALINIIGIGE